VAQAAACAPDPSVYIGAEINRDSWDNLIMDIGSFVSWIKLRSLTTFGPNK
jgi:hypothetical protein